MKDETYYGFLAFICGVISIASFTSYFIVKPSTELLMIGIGSLVMAIMLWMEINRLRGFLYTGALYSARIYDPMRYKIVAWTGEATGVALTVLSLSWVPSLAALAIGVGLILLSSVFLIQEMRDELQDKKMLNFGRI